MSVSPEEVLRLARLAELAIDPADLPVLSAQMDRIVSFVAQLSTLDISGTEGVAPVGPARSTLREDVVVPANLGLWPREIAPEFVDGFFVVPRLGAMDPP